MLEPALPATAVAIAAPMSPHPCRVARRRRELRDVVTLELEPPGGVDFRFKPGQFNMLYLFGVGEVPISISGDPARPRRLAHTVRAVGAVSGGLCALAAGSTVGVRGPFGSCWPMAAAEGQDVVIVAGGIGLAPLRPAVYHLLEHRERYGRVAILVGARSPRDLLFARQLESWRGRFDLGVEVTVDHAPAGWRGDVGMVTALIPRAGFDPRHAVALVCGPEVMMRFTVRQLERRGVERENIHLSMERNMHCAVGLCGHCQFGPEFVCKDGPVFPYPRVADLLDIREV